MSAIAPSAGSGLDAQRLSKAVARWLATDRVQIDDIRLLGGGASREIWAFDVVVDHDRLALVLRRNPASREKAAVRRWEYEVLLAVAKAGVPVAEPCFCLEVADGLGDGFVMKRVEGETLPTRILRESRLAEARRSLTGQCGLILAAIHSISLSQLPLSLANRTGDDPAGSELEGWYRQLHETGEPHPALEVGYRWLKDHRPGASRTTLVHGDFRNGNLVVGPDGIRAVLDWELCHTGDPMEDLGWLCVRSWRFTRPDLPVGGFGTRAGLFNAYGSATGTTVDAEVVHYWEVFGNFKWAVICGLQASLHLSGAKRSMELAAIGRRACEPEWDMLQLIGEEQRS